MVKFSVNLNSVKWIHVQYKGSYVNAYVFLNLLNKLRKMNKMRDYVDFRNELNKGLLQGIGNYHGSLSTLGI